MKQINFNNPGGFPLEQETLERIQIAFREELYEVFKSHLGISTQENYIIAKPESINKLGWLIIHQSVTDFEGTTLPLPTKVEGILYPLLYSSNPTYYIKTTRTVSKLVFGDGSPKDVYVDYKAEYITQAEYTTFGNSPISNEVNGVTTTTIVYDITTFEKLATIPELANKFLPLAGFVPMQGDLNLGTYQLSKLDTMPEVEANVRSQKLKLGHPNRRGSITGANYLGTALEDTSASGQTSLTLNPNAEWNTTEIGGNVKLSQVIETPFDTTKQSLVIDNNGFVTKTKDIFSNQIQSLIDRIVLLEARPLGNIPVGMVAIWGRPANEIPNGWVEYTDLRGRMPIGLDPSDQDFKIWNSFGGSKTKSLNAQENGQHTHDYYDIFHSEIGGYVGVPGNLGSGDSDGDNSGYQIKRSTESSGNGKPFSLLNPYRVVHFIQFIGDGSNNVAPIINNIKRADTNALVTATPIDFSFTGNSANLNFIATVNDSDSANNSLIFNWEFISGPAVPGDWFTGTKQINTDNSISIPLSIIGMSTTTTANPYKFKFTVTDNFGAKTEQIITINVTRQAEITNYSVIPAESINSSSRNYVTRVTGTPGETVSIKASISDLTNLVGIGGYTTGNMIVRLNSFNGDLVKNFFVTNTTDLSTLVHNFNITIGQSGTTDIYTNISVSEALIASNITEDLYLSLNGQLEIVNSSQAAYMRAEYLYTYTGGGSCFDTESLITMASGQSKKLKNVVAGDKLAALNFPNLIDESQSNYLDWKGKLNEATKAEVTVVGKTTHTVQEYYEILLADSHIVKVTAGHPLLVTEDNENVLWIKVRNINENMKLIDKNGTPKAITSITLKNETLEVALLDVEDIDDYVVSGIIAHNIPINQKN